MKDNNITILRNIAIICIVIHHSMMAFCGWPPNHSIGGYIPSWTYLINFELKALGLGAFTFISGYVLFYQNNKKESFSKFLFKKTKRILLPCLFFGVIYGILFPDFMYNNWPSIINGTHLWYLPMLFLCIFIVSVDIFCRNKNYLIFIAWISFYLLGSLSHFRTFTAVFYYLPIFVSGYILNKYKLYSLIYSKQNIAILFIFACIFLIISSKYIPYFGNTIKEVCYAVSGYIIITLIQNNSVTSFVANTISNSSFSIYLLHQFVINILLLIIPFITLNYYISLTILIIISFFIPILLNTFHQRIISIFSKF